MKIKINLKKNLPLLTELEEAAVEPPAATPCIDDECQITSNDQVTIMAK